MTRVARKRSPICFACEYNRTGACGLALRAKLARACVHTHVCAHARTTGTVSHSTFNVQRRQRSRVAVGSAASVRTNRHGSAVGTGSDFAHGVTEANLGLVHGERDVRRIVARAEVGAHADDLRMRHACMHTRMHAHTCADRTTNPSRRARVGRHSACHRGVTVVRLRVEICVAYDGRTCKRVHEVLVLLRELTAE